MSPRAATGRENIQNTTWTRLEHIKQFGLLIDLQPEPALRTSYLVGEEKKACCQSCHLSLCVRAPA